MNLNELGGYRLEINNFDGRWSVWNRKLYSSSAWLEEKRVPLMAVASSQRLALVSASVGWRREAVQEIIDRFCHSRQSIGSFWWVQCVQSFKKWTVLLGVSWTGKMIFYFIPVSYLLMKIGKGWMSLGSKSFLFLSCPTFRFHAPPIARDCC